MNLCVNIKIYHYVISVNFKGRNLRLLVKQPNI